MRHPGFEHACVVTADLSPLAAVEKLQFNVTTGRYYWSVSSFDFWGLHNC